MTDKEGPPKPPKRKRDFSVRSFKIPSIFRSKSPQASSSSLPDATTSTTPPVLIPQRPVFIPFKASPSSTHPPSTQSFVGVSQSGRITHREEKTGSKYEGARAPFLGPSAPPSVAADMDPAFPTSNRDPLPSLLPYESELYSSGGAWDPPDPVQSEESVPVDKASPSEEWETHHRSTFLQEMMWLEGRGGEVEKTVCGCGAKDPTWYRCTSCTGDGLMCSGCMVKKHAAAPFHTIEVWTGLFFERTTLKKLGLRIQLGHNAGTSCPLPKPSYNDDFVVLDVTGIHEVALSFCACETAQSLSVQLLRHRLFPATTTSPRSAATFNVLKFFHLMSFESKGSHEEFYNTLARLTGNVNPHIARDRYHEFIAMVTQWRNLKMLRRAGRGHADGGVAGTKPGECAVRCPACPQPNVNLPIGWNDLPDNKRWIYRLFVAIDGNFRLKRRKVSSDKRDPGLGHGWAFFVEEKAFKAHLTAHWDYKQDRSSCVAHDAVDKPDKEARGLAASGVVGIVCTRHEFKLPNGIGDLQRGERYINVDYVLFSALMSMADVRDLVISYDIICQWYKNLHTRMGILPTNILPVHDIYDLVFLIPKFHLPAHIDFCNRTFSFNLSRWVGRSDGEAPERGWSRINNVGKSTAEMGPGTRRDTIDDHFNDGNWKKTSSLGDLLHTKMHRATLGKSTHQEAYLEFSASIPPSFVKKWESQVAAWEAQPSEATNPFCVETTGPTEQKIRLDLAKEAEQRDQQQGIEGLEGNAAVHPSLFVAQGLQLEEDQHKLRDAVKDLGNHPTPKQLSTLAERSNALRRKILSWTEVQRIYLPDAELARQKKILHATHAGGSPSTEAYDYDLMLPSAFPPSVSNARVQHYEAELRIGQAYDCLTDLRRHLRLRSYLLKRKDMYSRGVAQNTRANVAIQRAQKQINWAASKYRRVRGLLIALRPISLDLQARPSWQNDLLVLGDKDIRGLSEGLFGDSEGSRTISWIWMSTSHTTGTDNIENDEHLQEAVRIEFLKSRARANRWSEEVELLEEEKRRTLEFFGWKRRWWGSHLKSSIGGAGLDYAEGFSAYAHSQARVYEELEDACRDRWSRPLKTRKGKEPLLDELDEDDD